MALPVIATRVTGCIDAVDDNVTGLFVEPDNVEQLTEAMLKLVEDPGLRKRLGRQGRQRVEKFFNSEGLIAKHLALYERILSSNK